MIPPSDDAKRREGCWSAVIIVLQTVVMLLAAGVPFLLLEPEIEGRAPFWALLLIIASMLFGAVVAIAAVAPLVRRFISRETREEWRTALPPSWNRLFDLIGGKAWDDPPGGER